MFLTSCDIAVNIGDWDNPVPSTPTPSIAIVTVDPVATTGDITAGSTTALVTAGTAEGGTMMYKVTAENTKPTSTDSFTATVPTAENCTAGTYYVWYYAKADADHSDSEISATAVTVNVLPGTVAVTSITLDNAIMRLDKADATPHTLTATVLPTDATDPTVTWTSDDETVVTVDATGKITMLKAGEVTITAKAGDKTATSTVYVYDKIVDISTGHVQVTENESWLINGDGTSKDYPIRIGNNAIVTLNGINISRGITCLGTATIILADGSTNIVDASGQSGEAGIRVGSTGNTLTINAETAGTGKLTATGGGEFSGGAGIGTRNTVGDNCGEIIINGGIITANGGFKSAGIGTAYSSGGNKVCGNITINGGTVTAIGGANAAGIGTGDASGNNQTCGTITIGAGVTSVTATKGTGATNSIGAGEKTGAGTQTCGAITIADPSKVTQN